MARGSQPGERRGGRQKGTPNKLTAVAREAIEQAAESLGGAQRLAAWAKEKPINERSFWTSIYPKLLPLQLTGKDDRPLIPEYNDTDRARALVAFIARTRVKVEKS